MIIDAETLYGLGTALIFIGMLVIAVAMVLLFLQGFRGGKLRGGGAIIIGPFPVVFGTDKESVKTILWLAVLLTVLLIALTVISYLIFR